MLRSDESKACWNKAWKLTLFISLRPCSVEVVCEGDWQGLRGIRSPTSQIPLQSTPIPLGGGLNEQGLSGNALFLPWRNPQLLQLQQSNLPKLKCCCYPVFLSNSLPPPAPLRAPCPAEPAEQEPHEQESEEYCWKNKNMKKVTIKVILMKVHFTVLLTLLFEGANAQIETDYLGMVL